MKNQICARHGHAVHAIAKEIRDGTLGNCAMLVDAECHERYKPFPVSFLPTLPENMQTSRLDSILLQNVFVSFDALSPSRGRDLRVIVHVIEVGYTSDMYLHRTAATKRHQHAQLCSNLKAFGWAQVQQHQLIIGHTGVMLCDNMAALQALGVCSQRIKAVLQELSLASLQKSYVILACFPYDITSTSPVQMRPSLPDPPSTPPPDSAHPQLVASMIMPQHAASSGPSAVQMTSQRHHAHITDIVTAMLPSDDSHVSQAPVPPRRGHKRRAPSTVTASQITRCVRQRSSLSHSSSHIDHQPRPSSAVPTTVTSVACSMSSVAQSG